MKCSAHHSAVILRARPMDLAGVRAPPGLPGSARGLSGERFRNDMLHIAVATVAEVDLLVSWNFRHIVRFDKIRLFSAVNLELGYRALAIYSPREVSVEGED